MTPKCECVFVALHLIKVPFWVHPCLVTVVPRLGSGFTACMLTEYE